MEEISGKHRIACIPNYEVLMNGTSRIRDVVFYQRPDGLYGITGGTLSNLPMEDTHIVIHSGGDVASASCLAGIKAETTECVDVTIVFQYSLTDQSDIEQEKKIRIVSYTDGHGAFKWYKESLDQKDSRCAGFYKGPSHP